MQPVVSRSYDDFIGKIEESSQRKSERRRAEREACDGKPQFECPECHVKYAVWYGKLLLSATVDDKGPEFRCKNCHEFLGDINFREFDLLL